MGREATPPNRAVIRNPAVLPLVLAKVCQGNNDMINRRIKRITSGKINQMINLEGREEDHPASRGAEGTRSPGRHEQGEGVRLFIRSALSLYHRCFPCKGVPN